jgi:hypothetical protein
MLEREICIEFVEAYAKDIAAAKLNVTFSKGIFILLLPE